MSAYVSIRQHTCALTSASPALVAPISRYTSIRQHTTAYVIIRQHTSAYVSIPGSWHHHQPHYLHPSPDSISNPNPPAAPAYANIRQHTSSYVSIRQHTSAYVSIRQHTSTYTYQILIVLLHLSIGDCHSVIAPHHYVSIRQHTSGYVSIRQHTSAYVSRGCRTSLPVTVTVSSPHSAHTITLAYVSIRQHTSAYARIRQHTSGEVAAPLYR
jgi:hypothetical protein